MHLNNYTHKEPDIYIGEIVVKTHQIILFISLYCGGKRLESVSLKFQI